MPLTRASDHLRKMRTRQEESQHTTEERLLTDRQRHARVTTEETQKVHDQRLQVHAHSKERAQNKRGQQSRNSAIVALSEYDDGVALLPQPLSVGDMIATCSACSANMWINETHGGCTTHNALT